MGNMGKVVGVRNQDVHYLITQAYQAGGEYQWAREAAVNAIQADATWIRFGVEEQGFAESGVARRYIADNGIGMNEEDLRIFLSSFGGGGRAIGMTANFGQGFKSSCYEWNPYGIIVVSWTGDTPDGRMIWIERVREGSETFWALRNFELDLGDGEYEFADCVAPAVVPEIGIDISGLKTPEIDEAGHGTVFLFLGDGPRRDTVNGDYLRGETSVRGIAAYLNARFIDMPEGVDLSVESLETREEDSPKDRYILDNKGERRYLSVRVVRGTRAGIKREGTVSGRMTARHGTTIQWYLTDAPDLKKDATYRPTKPSIMVKYDDEAYNVRSDAGTYRRFGISEPEIQQRLWLIIEPPKFREGSASWGVFPQASRGTLMAKGGGELPWDDWFDHFYTHMPQEIREALAECRAGESSDDPADRRERLKRVQSRFGTRWRPAVLGESIRGRLPGHPAAPGDAAGPNSGGRRAAATRVAPAARGKNVGSGGKTVILDPDSAGKAFGFERRKSDGIPAVEWDKSFSEPGERQFAARFDSRDVRDGSHGTVHFNASWPMFAQQIQFWQEEFPRADAQAVQELVRGAYEDEVVSKVMHAYKLRNSVVGFDNGGEAMRQLGNAVPVVLAQLVALSVREHLDVADFRAAQRSAAERAAARRSVSA